MPYIPTQQTFLGCSITGFNTSFDWSSGGTISISLVEDIRNYDELVNPQLGYPARFQYDGYIFDGIIQEFVEKRSTSGNRTLEAILTHPAQIVEGVQLIIGGYTGSIFTMYNLYNIYGQLELGGFGNSLVNEAGMNWSLLVSTLISMVDSWPIRFNGVPYFLDLSEIPTNLPQYYRIGGDSLSLAELVTELCDACGCDYFWDLYGNIIKLRVANRSYQPTFGAIQQFIDSQGGKTASQIGTQLEYNTTGRFISGGDVEGVYFQTNNLPDFTNYALGERDEAVRYHARTANILPYFGLTSDGSVVLPQNLQYYWNEGVAEWRTTNNLDLWYVNSNSILGGGLSFPVGFPITITQLRYALAGPKEWENYMVGVSGLDFLREMHDDFNPYKGINDMLEIDAEISKNVKDIIQNLKPKRVNKLKPLDIVNLDTLDKVLSVKGQRVFEFVSNLANEFFGRKFMVRLPSLYVKRDTDTGVISTSYEIGDSGYVEESLFRSLVNNGVIPNDTLFITNEQNKIETYVKFTGFQSSSLNLSLMSPNDYVVSGNNVFIKCSVEPEFVYLNRSTLFDPRAVITLPAPVYSTEYDIDTSSSVITTLRQHIVDKRQKFIDAGDGDPLARQQNGRMNVDIWLADMVAAIGFDTMREPIPPIPLIPALAAIPVKSNVETYGPWFYTGSNGKVEYEQNTDLVPWNFGGYAPMNQMGNALVSEAIASRFASETGSVDVPGAPLARTGEILIAGGPYVTGLDVSVDANGGATTSYRFNSWNVKQGKTLRQTSERYRKLLEISRKQKRNLRNLVRPKSEVLTTQVRLTQPQFPRRLKSNTPHDMILGEVRPYDSNDKLETTITLMPFYNAMNATQDSDGYDKKAGFTLDGLFRPFSTDVNVSGIAHFETPIGSASQPNVTQLNPFGFGHDIGASIRGNERPHDLKNDGSSGLRGIALRGPLVLSGWGYDTNGKPVPNANESTPTSEFLADYLIRSDKWKTGPVDIRWNNEKKIWQAGETIQIKKFLFYGSGTVDFIGNDGVSVKSSGLAYQPSLGASGAVYIIDGAGRNFLLRSEPVMCMYSDNNWYIVGENGLHRSAVSNTEITYGAQGNCKVKTNTSVNLQASFDRLGRFGDTIDRNKDVELRYIVESNKWIVNGAACND